MWIGVSIAVAAVLVVIGLVGHLRKAKTATNPVGSGMSKGLVIGMLASAAVCIPLRELGGWRAAVTLLLPCGIAAGGIIGLFLERRYQRQ